MRSAPYFAIEISRGAYLEDGYHPAQSAAGISRFDKGIISVELVNQAPKDRCDAKDPKAKKPVEGEGAVSTIPHRRT